MGYIRENKSKGIKEDYIPDWIEQIKIIPFTPNKVAGINDPQINQDISIET